MMISRVVVSMWPSSVLRRPGGPGKEDNHAGADPNRDGERGCSGRYQTDDWRREFLKGNPGARWSPTRLVVIASS